MINVEHDVIAERRDTEARNGMCLPAPRPARRWSRRPSKASLPWPIWTDAKATASRYVHRPVLLSKPSATPPCPIRNPYRRTTFSFPDPFERIVVAEIAKPRIDDERTNVEHHATDGIHVYE